MVGVHSSMSYIRALNHNYPAFVALENNGSILLRMAVSFATLLKYLLYEYYTCKLCNYDMHGMELC